MYRSLTPLALALPAALLSGCGGSEATPDPSGASQNFGSVTTRIVGTAAAPVVSSGYGATAVGVAGATFSDITQSYALTSLSNTRIAFSSYRDGNYEVYSMKADGTGQTRLTTNVAYDSVPSWSPDGARIAFTNGRDGNYEIYAMKADGTGLTRLTNNVATDNMPSWSPDGTRIAFSSGRDGNYEIYSMKADGTGQTRLTNNVAVDYALAWSPDGTRIAFTSYRDGNSEIYSMIADGTAQTRLTNNAAADDNPAWSPDSTRIAFTSGRDGNYEIYSMVADGSYLTRLTNYGAEDNSPSWSGYLRSRYVGTGGILGSSCAGFLASQQGDAIASLLVFDTPLASRAGARVTANTSTDTNGPNLVFTLTTTAGMSSLKFVNAMQSLTPVTVALPAGTTSALVLLNSNTGLVVSVLPYAANRGVPARTPRGDLATYTGDFSAIFDSDGKNLAPGGARSVTLDERDGRLVRYE